MRALAEEPEHAARWVSPRIQGDLGELMPSFLPSGNAVVREFPGRARRRSRGPAALLVRLVLIQRLPEMARREERPDFEFRWREPDEPTGRPWEYVVRLKIAA
jgi:hypothetical protein